MPTSRKPVPSRSSGEPRHFRSARRHARYAALVRWHGREIAEAYIDRRANPPPPPTPFAVELSTERQRAAVAKDITQQYSKQAKKFEPGTTAIEVLKEGGGIQRFSDPRRFRNFMRGESPKGKKKFSWQESFGETSLQFRIVHFDDKGWVDQVLVDWEGDIEDLDEMDEDEMVELE